MRCCVKYRIFSFSSLFAVTGTAILLTGCKSSTTAPATAAAATAIPVVTAVAATATIPVEIAVVGTVEASETVQIKSQVAGQILKVHFTEGQTVRKDDLLFTIDDQPFRQALAQFEAAVARDKGALRQAEATLVRDTAQAKNTAAEVARYAELHAGGIISATQYDQMRTSGEVAQATVQASKAAIESAQASLVSDLAGVEKAKIDIAYCSIRSPISGRTGMLQLHAGNLVKVNDVTLVVVNKISPVYVTFSVPERHLVAIRKLNASGKLPVRASLRDNPGVAATGYVSVIDNAVDPATGTIRLRATFENTNGVLWAGQFADVQLGLGAVSNATLVPTEAVQPGQNGSFVYRVKADSTVEMIPVTTGESHSNKTAIVSGLKPGDIVVTDGHLRLAPGARVRKGADPNAAVTP